jgi:uncharacterized protein (TIGR02217 family)
MSGFHDVRFPISLTAGAVGGPERRTEVLTLASGREVRNAVWAGSRRRWDVGSAVSDLKELQELVEFFEARMGQLYGFRFRDPIDHSSAPAGGDISAEDQMIGVGDGEKLSFQLIKNYGGVTRDISKPVTGSVQVAVDGVVQTGGWSLDMLTGGIVFDAPPGEGAMVTAGFEFDCAVRFERDRLEAQIESFHAGRVIKLGLIELV